MLRLRQGVKSTSAHVHDPYSSSYNMLLLTVYISWHVTFGLHTGPLSDTVKSAADGLQLLGVQEEKLYIRFEQ
jgi:hypothetical protein